ncbi:MAG: hypothetical protein AAFW89_05305 [Bacteroidota bacterium]
MKQVEETEDMQELHRNAYIIRQFHFLEEDYGFERKEVLRLHYTPQTRWEKFKWERCDVTVEIIHEYGALPYSIVYKRMEYELIKFSEPNCRMGLSRLKDKRTFRKRLSLLFNKLTDEDFEQRVDFLRDELSACIKAIIAF